MTRWVRPRHDRVLAGVSGAIAHPLGLPSALVRVLFALLALVYGLGFVLYAAGAVLLPDEESHADRYADVVRDNISSLLALLQELRWALVDGWRDWRQRRTWGIPRERALAILGLSLVIGAGLGFLSTFGLLDWLSFERFAALGVLTLGVALLVRGSSRRS